MLIFACMNVNASLTNDGTTYSYSGYVHNTFVDSTTSLRWLKLDEFYDKSKTDQLSMIELSNYRVATESEVSSMLDPIMGVGKWSDNIGLFTGFYFLQGFKASGRVLTSELVANSFSNLNNVTTSNLLDSVDDSHVGLWAVQKAQQVPIPPTTVLLFLGSLALLATTRRRKQALTPPTQPNTNVASA